MDLIKVNRYFYAQCYSSNYAITTSVFAYIYSSGIVYKNMFQRL